MCCASLQPIPNDRSQLLLGGLTCLRGAFPPVDLRAVCLVRAIVVVVVVVVIQRVGVGKWRCSGYTQNVKFLQFPLGFFSVVAFFLPRCSLPQLSSRPGAGRCRVVSIVPPGEGSVYRTSSPLMIVVVFVR